MMIDFGGITSFLAGAATAWAVFALVYGGPRLIRSAQRWTTAVLFASLSKWDARFAGVASALAIFWLFLLAGAFYAPVAAIAHETIPSLEGAGRYLIGVNLWLLVVGIPLAFGVAEGIAEGRRGRIGLATAGLWHLSSLAIALAMFLPWVVWRRIVVVVTRKRRDIYSADIELPAYPDVVKAMCVRFEKAGLPCRVIPAHPAVRIPRYLIDNYGPPRFRLRQPYEVRLLRGDGFELTLYAALIDLVARKDIMGRTRTALLGDVPPPGFWWTRSAKGRALEAAILGRDGAAAEGIPERLAALESSVEEWRALQREYLISRWDRGGS